MQTETAKSPGNVETTNMVHLGHPDTPPSVTLCGAVTKENLPDDIELDCIVCAEMAKAQGYLV